MYLVAVDTRSPMPDGIFKLIDTKMSYPNIWGETVEEVESMTENGTDFAQIKSIIFRDSFGSEKQMSVEEVFNASRPDEEGGFEPLENIHKNVIGFRPDSVVINLADGQIVYKAMNA